MFKNAIASVVQKYQKPPAEIPFKDDLEQFGESYLKIQNKEKELVPLRFNPAQRQYFRECTSRDLILKARQLGFSTAIEAKLFHKAITRSATIGVLAHEDATTQKLRRMVERFYQNMPIDIRPVRKYANTSLSSYPVTDSEMVIATAGNKNTGRGGTYSDVHCSEVAFFKDAAATMAGILQGGNPNIVLESTANGAQGYFYNLCMEALDGNSIWKLHFFAWWIDPSYRMALAPDENLVFTDEEKNLMTLHNLTPEQIKWRRYKQQELKGTFLQEYPEDPKTCFLQSGYGYFGDLLGVFDAPFGAVYQPDHRYVAGLDFGQVNDFTVLSIFDATARVQVDLVRLNQMSWGDLRAEIFRKCQYWHVDVLVAESNAMGSTNIEELDKLFADEWRKTHVSQPIVESFATTNDSKSEIMLALHEGIHTTLKLLPVPDQKKEFAAFKAVQTASGKWQLAAPTGDHDDTVIGAALGWYAVHSNRRYGGIHF